MMVRKTGQPATGAVDLGQIHLHHRAEEEVGTTTGEIEGEEEALTDTKRLETDMEIEEVKILSSRFSS